MPTKSKPKGRKVTGRKTAAKAPVDKKTADAKIEAAVIKTLAPIVKEVNTRLEKAAKLQGDADDHRLAASLRLAEAKEKAEKGGLSFKKWAEENITAQSYETVRKLAAVGASDNPAEALATMRERNAEANKRLAAKKREQLAKAKDRKPGTPKVDPVTAALSALDRMKPKQREKLIKAVAENEGLAVAAPKTASAPVEQGGMEGLKLSFLQLDKEERAEFAAWASAKVAEVEARSSDDLEIPAALKRERRTRRAAA